MPVGPRSEFAVHRNLARRVRVVEPQPVRDGTSPTHVAEQCFMDVESERLLVGIARCELDECAVCDDLPNLDVRVLRVECGLAPERGDYHMRALGNDARYVVPENSGVAANDPQLLD